MASTTEHVTLSPATPDSGGASPPAAGPKPGRPAVGSGQLANLLLRLAAAAAGVALTLRLSAMPETVGPAEVGFLAGLYSAMELLAAIPSGGLSDRWGRRPLLMGGAVAGSIGLLITGYVTSLPLLALGRVVQGLGTGCTVPPLLGWFSDITATQRAGRRGRVMAGVEAGTAAGLLAGTVLGSIIWNRAHVAGFPLLAVLYVAAAALLARVPSFTSDAPHPPLASGPPGRERATPLSHTGERGTLTLTHTGEKGVGRLLPEGREPPLSAQRGRGGEGVRGALGWLADLRPVLATPGLTRLLIAWVLLNSVVGLWLTHAVYQMNRPVADPMQFLVGRFHGSLLSAVLGLWMLVFIAGSLGWGPLLARVPAWHAMRIALVGMLVVCLSLVLLNAGWASAGVRWAALPVFCLGVVTEAGFAPAALSQLAVDAGDARRGMTMGLYSVALGLGNLFGSWAGTPFSSLWAMNGIVAFTALLAATALAVLSAGHRPPGGASSALRSASCLSHR